MGKRRIRKVNQFAIELSREAQVEAASIGDEDHRSRATKHALNIGNRQKIVAALALAEGNRAITFRPPIWTKTRSLSVAQTERLT